MHLDQELATSFASKTPNSPNVKRQWGGLMAAENEGSLQSTPCAATRTTCGTIYEPVLDGSKDTNHQDQERFSGSPMNPSQQEDDGNGLEASGSDSERDADIPVSKPKAVSERRRLQTAKFKSWFSTRVEKMTGDDLQSPQTELNEELQSTSYLVAQQESNVIISDPREYQVELFERAKERNTIAVLDTGSGKTLIAVLLLRHVVDQELEDRGMGKPARIAFFLVDSVTLVFQQHAVLACNLDQNIERFCGEMGCDLWTKDVWEKHFRDNMIIVCTAEVLYQCLMHSFITIDRINLLIFDEAHHAKKNHAYARIMKDFYLDQENSGARPRIFGMTASPVDARVDVIKAAKELEMLLQCQIATTYDLTLLRKSVHRPQEEVAGYDPLPLPFETPFYQKLHHQFGSSRGLSRMFRNAKLASSELGSWCADYMWTFLLEPDEVHKIENRLERDFHEDETCKHPLESLDAELAQLRHAVAMIKDHQLQEPNTNMNDLSSKVFVLHNYLNRRFALPTDDKCIVFVRKRYTARLLGELFTRTGTPNLRVGILLGARKGEAGDVKVSYRQQIVTLTRFRKGTLNCLFATSVAEEGLDIPDCNLVIRFDIYDTLIQYIQSRGRARRHKSTYVHMLENGNPAHQGALREVRRGENIMREFCESLPADRLLLGNECDLDGITCAERSHRSFTEKSTGAKLTYNSSLAVLSHFVTCLPQQEDTISKPNYVMAVQNKFFICEVILPESSPLHSVTGRPHPRKSIAKRSAAFEACVWLRKEKYLDANLLPIYRRQLPAMRNAQLALNMKNTKPYDMRNKPSIWAGSVGSVPQELFLMVIDLAEPEKADRPCQPVAMLTRTRLPDLPQFPLYFQSGASSPIVTTVMNSSLVMTQKKLDLINAFTLRIFKDIFNKLYEDDVKNMPYFLAPVVPGFKVSPDTSGEDLIDWNILDEVFQNECFTWSKQTPDGFLVDKFIVDRWDGSRRYFSIRVDPSRKPLDRVPAGVPPRKFMNNILDWSNSMFRKSRARVTFQTDQPVILADRIVHRRNWLDEMTETEKNVVTECYICPEPLQISALPIRVAAMGLMLPAIIFRLDSFLIALELFDMLNLKVWPSLALEAVTKDSDNTEEHREEQIHFQRGMGRNYERLEFIGDCFLKMATSIAVYTHHPDKDEYEYHVTRMLMLCNKNLFNTANKLKIYERVWYPEEPKLLQGKGVNKEKETASHVLADKTIADVCEALIGAALLSYHETRDFDMAVKAVSAMVNNPLHSMYKWTDYYTLYRMPGFQAAPATRSQLDLAEQVAKKHNYRFKYPRLLRSAFIHPSYPFSWEKIPCYQRLEFLGDSLLDMACVNFLFLRFPDRDPQWLTEHKMAMVSNRFLGALCVRLEFHRHLRLNSAIYEAQIREYVTDIQAAEQEANGARDYWVHARAAPKVNLPVCWTAPRADFGLSQALPDVMEAYIGAMFVDSEYNYSEVEHFFDTHIRWFFEDMSIYDTFANNHPTTFLTNLLTLSFNCTHFRILAQEIPALTPGSAPHVLSAVMVHNDIIAEGRASSGRTAKVNASSNALEVLKGLSETEYRRQYGCDCRPIVEEEEGKLERLPKKVLEEMVGAAT